jgi:type II secretory pathway component PulF
MSTLLQPLFADLAGGLLALLQFILAFVGYVLLFAVPVGALTVLIHFFLSLPLRRRERARLFLDLLETGLAQGRSAEHTLVAVAGSRDRTLGVRFQLLAAHLETGLRLDAALDRVPRLLPPPVAAMLRVGVRLGDLRRVLPACREWLRERPASVQSAYHYLIMLLVVFSPVAILLLINLNVFVWPKLKEVFVGMGEGAALPAFTRLALNSTGWLVGAQGLFMFGLFVAAFAYIAGPRVTGWLQWGGYPLVDWLAWRTPWKRKRLTRTFSATLAVLLDGGVPEAEAVKLAGDCTANEIARRRAARVVAAVQQGTKLQDAVAAFDDRGEFKWRLTNACHARDGFLRALNGWHEALDAKAFQQEEAAAHSITSGLVLFNGAVVALTAVAVFAALIAILERAGT